MKKLKRPKKVSYTLIPPGSDIGVPMYERLQSLIDAHHEDLSRFNVRIALAWATSWKADVDGRVTLGKCKKASELDRELAPYDFVILLSQSFWQNTRVTDVQRNALLDHELMHAAVSYDENGEAKTDERGRTCYRIRKHDLEEFADIAKRYGLWKSDIVAFMRALEGADKQVQAAQWVSYSATRDALSKVGYYVPKEAIATWSEDERREVMTFALLRYEGEQRLPTGVEIVPPTILIETLRAAETAESANANAVSH